MTPEVRRLVLGIVLVLLAAGTWWLARPPAVPEVPPIETREGPDDIIENFTATVMNERGEPQYVLQAVRLMRFPDDGRSELDQPYLVQYGEGTPVHTRARRGLMPADRHWIRLTGDVLSTRGRDPRHAGGEIRAEEMLIELDK